MSSVKQIEALKSQHNLLDSEIEAICLQIDEYQEMIDQLKSEINIKKEEKDSLAGTISLIDMYRTEVQEAFNTLCVKKAAGELTDAHFQTFAKEADVQIQTESETEEEGAEEAA